MNPSNQAFKKYGFWFGLVTFLILTFSNTQTSITSEAWAVLSIMLLMIVWWLFEVIPILCYRIITFNSLTFID